ncbi:MAG: glycosyltransferase family 4 protein [Parcubacteria group bacterium]|nr:glycosyltransferase family 4 protein [Parcubacteria group bacterium]
MKIHIAYNFKQGPWGGGNQFLKSLKEEFKRRGVYVEEPDGADVVLFNSHHQLGDALKIKLKHSEKILIHRLGPVFYYHRGKRWKKYDKQIIKLSNKVSNGVVFQSNWSLNEALRLGFNKEIPHKVIFNATDASFFNKNNKKSFNTQQKIKLMAMSWSANLQKGFDIYQYLDENLDFSKYEMTFVGNAPVKFKNIKQIKPSETKEVAMLLKQNDIFVFASKNEACSNALIEAMSCGLPVIALNSASNAEIVKQGGELFQSSRNVIEKIEKVANNYDFYASEIPEFSMDDTTQQYYSFSQKIYNSIKENRNSQKRIGLSTKISFIKLKFLFDSVVLFDKIGHKSNR